jgi:hypothetical protein
LIATGFAGAPAADSSVHTFASVYIVSRAEAT